MTDATFDALTRRTAVAMLGAAGLASLAAPFAADAKGKKRKKRRRKRKQDPNEEVAPAPAPCVDECQPQIEKCRLGIAAELCPRQPERCESARACCDFLGSCQTIDFLVCLFTPSENEN